MRRWIAILLLALLPFQFTWAGAVDFCAHAEGQVQHGAASQADDADGGSVPSQAGAEAGCEQCPCHAVGLVGLDDGDDDRLGVLRLVHEDEVAGEAAVGEVERLAVVVVLPAQEPDGGHDVGPRRASRRP